eukprot:Gregarina_sp_Pseudo_9__5605@NODE_767_length_2243_cov_14_980944_g722_i0_p1_GENE_NODE_767_length_2243_cov_14_980944_g722_i0NODE_767_length_2243_cov_14_980944_g722_i0_p1_ORF_typecomplete_len685_score80_88POP1/PF06978_11/6_9e28POPLD/PF08170_12/8e03POPLD/PF08170_12/9_2e16_NODE_767_length_2243_cov_14_980944_g722_i0892143
MNPLQQELPAYIEVQDFVAERASESAALVERLATKKEGKRSFQKLHYEFRRRAQSHNPYRIPRKCRAPVLRDMETAPPVPSRRPRRDRRRPRSIQDCFGKRSERSGRWLETHLWHTKRMKMHELWGFKLAVLPTQKSKRKIYRLANRRSIIYDESYFICWDLRERSQVFLKQSCEVVGTKNSNYYEVFVYKEDKTLLCPAQILETLPDHVYFFFHPSVENQCRELLNKLECVIVEIPMVNRFRLLGPDSWNLFTQTFRSENCEGVPNENLWSMSLGYLQARLLHGCCFRLRANVPRLLGPFPPKTRSRWSQLAPEQTLPIPLDEARRRLSIMDCFSFLSSSPLTESLIEPPPPLLQDKFRHTLRSTKRLDSRRIALKLRTTLSQNYAALGRHEPPPTTVRKTDIVVVFRYFGSLPEVLLMIPSNAGARNVWTLLVRQGCRAIGLENLRKLSLNENRPLFPQHWVNTEAGRDWELLQTGRRQRLFESRPPSKRLHPRLLSPGFPFGGFCVNFSRWLVSRTDANFLGHSVIAARRLDPEYCPTNMKDVGILCSVQAVSKRVPKETALLAAPPTFLANSLASSETLPPIDADSLEFVGTVIDGEHNLKLGRGFGFGVISVAAYLNRMREVQSMTRLSKKMQKEMTALKKCSTIMFRSPRLRDWTSVTFLCRNPGACLFWVIITPVVQ